MATLFIIDGKPGPKVRLPYAVREGEIVRIKDAKEERVFAVEFIEHRIDRASPIGIADTHVHLKSGKKSKKEKKEKNGAI